jgi:hypothetical protein
MPAPGPFVLLDVSPSAFPLSVGAGLVIVLPFTDAFGVAFAVARADVDADGAVEVVARAVGRAFCVWPGAAEGLVDGTGRPEPTTIVPVIVGWMEQ